MRTGKHILLVEDNATTRECLALLLQRRGYRVTCTANGQEALDALQDDKLPFVILLDLSMPTMNGWQFRERQQQSPTLCSIPVFLLSGEADLPEIAASLAVTRYFFKPVEWDRLFDALRLLGEAPPPPRQAAGKVAD